MTLARARAWGTPVAALAMGACLKLAEPVSDDGQMIGDARADTTPDATAPATLVPTTRPALDDFLVKGDYLSFAAESKLHQSEGPHFGRVRTFMNPLLVQSLQRNANAHPAGAAAIKELYKGGTQLAGWAVMVKLRDGPVGGDGYLFFEAIDGRVVAEGQGHPACVNCHEAGQDLILSPFPLQ